MCSSLCSGALTAAGGQAGERKREDEKSAKAAAVSETAVNALRERLFDLRKKGFGRLFQNGQIFEFATPESLLDIDFSQPVYVLIDRIVVGPDQRTRIVDALETGYREAGETVFNRELRAREPSARLRQVERPRRWASRLSRAKERRRSSGDSAIDSNARTATLSMKSRSRRCFHLTILLARAPGARDLATR